MGFIKTLERLRAGYPGGWRRYARGTARDQTPPFVQPTDPDDRRSLIPALGLKEYWYPALPAKDVGWKKPVGLRICGIDFVFFRDKNGEVQALWDYCPHRGAYLSWGDCFWKGYVSCPYHGATFDGNGECVEFITEGPDSKMPGRLKARKYPTQTLRGIVFVWTGEGEPAPIEEDVPPEFFMSDEVMIFTSWRYWGCNWMVALENTWDAHNAFMVHRNSLMGLRSRYGLRPRTPVGYRATIVNNRAVMSTRGAERYYAGPDGKIPYQMYYPRVGAYWPLHCWRLLWTWATERLNARSRNRPGPPMPDEWATAQHLPAIVRISQGASSYTRWCIPVEENLTRVLYLHTVKPPDRLGRIWERAFWPIHKWVQHFNFSDQDYDAMRGTRYQYPEFLSSTDSFLVMLRKAITEHGRGIQRTVQVKEETTAERRIHEAYEKLGLKASDVGLVIPGGNGRDGARTDIRVPTGQEAGG